MKILAYACSARPNALWSAAQYDNALSKNRVECDIPLVSKADAESALARQAEALQRENGEKDARIALIREALLGFEHACEQLAATRSHEIYTAMIDGGQAQELLELDNARRRARALLGGENAE